MIHSQTYVSVNKLLEHSIRMHWDRPALSNYKGAAISYGEAARLIKNLHICFSNCGLKKGETVALCSRNQANWGVCFMAALTYGAVAVPILHEFKPENIHYLVNHSDARVLFVDDVVWEGLSETEMPNLQVVVRMNDFQYLYAASDEFVSARNNLDEVFSSMFPNGFHPEDVTYCDADPDDLALINYTSGTSGFSKGVMLPHRSIWRNIAFAKFEAAPQMNCESEMVAMLPSAHMYGMMFEFLFEMTIGAHVHFLTRVPSPKIILNAFQEIHPDLIIAVPLIIEKVYKSQIKPVVDRKKWYLNIPILDQYVQKRICNGMVEAFGGRFDEVILGGAAFNPEVEQFLRRIRFPFTVGYGMTECGPIITYCDWRETREGSCGKAIERCRIRIDSADPVNIPGEILVKGENVFLGYYKNEAATREVFTEDGWFKTGDMGVMDNDGYLFLHGRCKCMILGPSGQNIYPEELEAVVNNVTYVVDSLVIEDNGGLTVLIYPDYHQAELDGILRSDLENRLRENLPQINKRLPSFAQIRKMEFIPEDFERTPKRNIKRYLYQRN